MFAKKKRVWVIGGCTGYGKEIVLFFLRKNYEVIISSSNPLKLKDFSEKHQEFKNLKTIRIDLSNEAIIERVCKKILGNTGLDHIFITSAISNSNASKLPFLTEKKSKIYKYFDINSIGPWLVIKNIFPKILKFQKSIKIYLFTSKAGWANNINFGFYNVSKSLLHHTIINLSEEIKINYEKFKCSFFLIEPGEAKTEMNKGSNISPKVIIPIIKYLENMESISRVEFIDRNFYKLKFCYKINEMYCGRINE